MEHYTEGQVLEFKEAFSLFDKEGRGYITSCQITKIVNMFGTPASKDAIDKFMTDYDDDKNGNLDFHEFLKMMARNAVVLNDLADDNIRIAFQALDKDNNGYIEKLELLQIMRGLGEQLTEKDVEDMIKEGDLDEDGRINLEEFTIIMNSK
ncbi:calmodulin-like [Bolinopsis microptera]|uniref:calmodulin-like n=1 Tax=Bolinopsis microptera TaxID=2820187 RepID=UPI003079CF32